MLNKPHVHAEVIKAWADGAIIQVQEDDETWIDCYENTPMWHPKAKYRVKPQKRKCWLMLLDDGDYWTTTADTEDELTHWKERSGFVRVLQEIEYEV